MYSVDIYQLEFISQTLRDMLKSIEDEFGSQVITSLFRINNSGVHGALPLRGVDLRARNHSLAEVMVSWINSHWFYDPTRPELKCSLAHGEGWAYHIHLQVHPKTVSKS